MSTALSFPNMLIGLLLGMGCLVYVLRRADPHQDTGCFYTLVMFILVIGIAVVLLVSLGG